MSADTTAPEADQVQPGSWRVEGIRRKHARPATKPPASEVILAPESGSAGGDQDASGGHVIADTDRSGAERKSAAGGHATPASKSAEGADGADARHAGGGSDPRAETLHGDAEAGDGAGPSVDRPGDNLLGAPPAESDGAGPVDTPTSTLADPVLALLAFALDDIEGQRKAWANRHRILTTVEPDEDGVVRGFGLPATDVRVKRVSVICDGFEALEHQAVLALQRSMRDHPLGPWITATKGLGEKTVARLLGVIGDPARHPAKGTWRTFGQLKSYCGLAPRDGRSPRRRRGQQVDWNGAARMRLWNIAQPIIKGTGPYRDVYDAAREKYADRTHAYDCERCGPSGKPALMGSPLAPGHQHAAAVHLVMVAVLRDLWREARRLHGLPTDLPPPIAHATPTSRPAAGPSTPAAIANAEPMGSARPELDPPGGELGDDTDGSRAAGATDTPPAIDRTTPLLPTRAEPDHPGGDTVHDAEDERAAGATDSSPDQDPPDAHRSLVGGSAHTPGGQNNSGADVQDATRGHDTSGGNTQNATGPGRAAAGPDTPARHDADDAESKIAGGGPDTGGHEDRHDGAPTADRRPVAAGHDTPAARVATPPMAVPRPGHQAVTS